MACPILRSCPHSTFQKPYQRRITTSSLRPNRPHYSPDDIKAFEDRALVCVFEGNDAAGKGGAIRRVRQALDPRGFQVHPVAAPTDEERARPYLCVSGATFPHAARSRFSIEVGTAACSSNASSISVMSPT